MTSILPVVQSKPVPAGTVEFNAARDAILAELAAAVPAELRLPESVINNPPTNVTNVVREYGILTTQELDITDNYDATALAEAIASKKFTAVAVATAFSKRAALAHQLTSCLTELFIQEAIEQAKALDAHLESTGQTVGPLHGVPVSIKCHVPIGGHWTDFGYLATRQLEKEDCQMTAILRKAGAVFYCKTNQPQALMHLESTSPVFGRVLNPHNINLSAGGSSGGEGALVAMRGSVLGVGTDIGGSVRGPSAFCGIYGFKATSYTLPTKSFLQPGYAAELMVIASTGPMCTSLRDMDLFMRVVLAAQPHLEDTKLVPIPWTGMSTVRENRPWKIGFMDNDGVITPQPPVTRAIAWARSKLEKAPGFDVKSFAPFRVADAMKLIRQSYWATGDEPCHQLLKQTGEPQLALTEWIFKEAAAAGPLTSQQLLDQRRTRDKFRENAVAHWNSQDVDLVIAPAFVGPACAHDTAWYWNYTAYWNYLDYPGAVIPTPIAAGPRGTEEYAPSSTVLSEEDGHVRQLWKEGDFDGAPINIQVVTRRHHDNELFAGLAALKDVLELK